MKLKQKLHHNFQRIVINMKVELTPLPKISQLKKI